MNIELADHEIQVILVALMCSAANAPLDLVPNARFELVNSKWSVIADMDLHVAKKLGVTRERFQAGYERWCRWFDRPVCQLRDLP